MLTASPPLLTSIVPRCSGTIRRQITGPKPVPLPSVHPPLGCREGSPGHPQQAALRGRLVLSI